MSTRLRRKRSVFLTNFFDGFFSLNELGWGKKIRTPVVPSALLHALWTQFALFQQIGCSSNDRSVRHGNCWRARVCPLPGHRPYKREAILLYIRGFSPPVPTQHARFLPHRLSLLLPVLPASPGPAPRVRPLPPVVRRQAVHLLLRRGPVPQARRRPRRGVKRGRLLRHQVAQPQKW